jgi:tetrahydromethanopterin S-methyltransferase subunit G
VTSRPRVRVAEEEMNAHNTRLEAIRKKAGQCIWEEG